MKRTGGGWNKGKVVGKKRPFNGEQVKMIRYALDQRGDVRGLALFETALSTMLRSSDLLALTIGDVIDGAGITTAFEVRQQKTGGVTVKCSLSERARTALATYLATEPPISLTRPLWLRNGRRLTRLRYAEIVKSWAGLIHADPKHYGTHSMRRTMAAHVYKQTQDTETVRQLLGHASVASTSSYLDVSRDQALDVKRKHEL